MKVRESLSDRIFGGSITFVLCIVGIVSLIPLITVLAMSFSSKSAADMNIVNLWPVGFTFASWKYIITNAAIWKSFGITVASTVVGTFLALAVTALMAFPLSRSDFKLSKIIMILVTITMVFKAPTVPYFLTLKGIGLFNNPLVLVLPHILTAYNMFIMRSFFQQFPEEVIEAAKLDGAGYFKSLFMIVIPSSKAVLATVGLFYGVTFWNQYQHPLMFLQNTSLFPLQMKLKQLISSGNEFTMLASAANVNYSDRTLQAAVVVFAIVPIIAIYPLLQKYFTKGAMLGSVKG